MEKKSVAIISIFVATLFLMSIIGSAQALGNGLTLETYIITPLQDPSTLTNMVPVVESTSKYILDGTVRINHGTIRKFDYQGPLGVGTFYLENLHNKGQDTIPYSNMIETGSGVYHYCLIIDDGPYGSGTLKGIGKMTWDYNLPAYQYEMWGTAKMVPVDGDLDINWVMIEIYQYLFDTWWTKTTVVS